MQTHVYRIDETQLNKIRYRLMRRALYIMVPTLAFIFFAEYLQMPKQVWATSWPMFFVIIPIMFVPVYFGTSKLVKAYRTLEIVLSDKGVEAKAEGMPYKKISWENLLVDEKPNGIIILADKSISSLTRWLNGAGKIFVQPETISRDVLLAELYKKQSAV